MATNGLSLAAWQWRAERRGHGPTLLMVHASSFHARVWDEVIRRLDAYHVIAIDQRGHGGSDHAPFESWKDLCWDLTGAAQALSLHGAIGIGHSMGGHALVRAASFDPRLFSSLLLIDPSLFAPAAYLPRASGNEAARAALGRKNRFASPLAMFERLSTRSPYSTFDPKSLRAYCDHGLRPAPDGDGYVLACAPATESRIYGLAHEDAGVYASIRALEIPVTVVRARAVDKTLPFDPLGSPTWPGIAAEFRHGQDLQLPDKTHLMAMEDPARTAQVIEAFLAGRASVS